MSRPDASEVPAYAQAYVDLVPGDDVIGALSVPGLGDFVAGVNDEWASSWAYAEGKWTLKEIVGHVADTERVFTYRALALSRGDTTPLPGFDQDAYVRAGGSNARPLADLLADLHTVRQATLSLLGALPADAWNARGVVSGYAASVRGLAFMIAGHELHHIGILRQRYLT